jgi:phage terminase large subunit
MPVEVEFPDKVVPVLFGKARYKILEGGRGGGKSHSVARYLVRRAARARARILCTREFQSSIRDSVHQLLCDQISKMGYDDYFIVQKDGIYSRCGSNFLFKGLRHDPMGIKSTEGINIAWVEEAHRISKESLEILIPTIREPNSELIFTYNADEEKDTIYQRFSIAANRPPETLYAHINFDDNPWFPSVLEKERAYCLKVDPEAYDHIWLGKPKRYGQSLIFNNKFDIEEFDTPEGIQLYYGADFGFSTSPTAIIRCFIKDECLWVDYEAVGFGVEINDTAQFFSSVPGINTWKIRADSARPETISYLSNHGMNIEAVEKGPNTIEEGIQFIRSFRRVKINPRCKHTIQNFENYRFKEDKITGEVLPIPIDAHNDCIDSIRYSLEPYIKHTATIFDVL